ncbi:hypothetical protein [Oceanobacillus sp. Castelsardo]|uniref:hypothetical protein n=1 Tax=Oceanobacillus sp. Castelsardo TaxID=1851204 RepID=UPI000837E851|nr:hypothetical protein [Oceanobacillus sp. Castelsardo]
MQSNLRLLNMTKYICATLLAIGTIIFMYGFVNGFSNIAGIGYGAVMGAVFIFIMGIFLVSTEEMLRRKRNGK